MFTLRMICMLFAFAMLTAGCSALVPKPDANVQYMIEQVVSPAVQKAVAETNTRTATMQAGLQGINPKYVVEFEGLWIVGVKGNVKAGLEGVSGQVTGHLQADNAAAPKPSTQPAQ